MPKMPVPSDDGLSSDPRPTVEELLARASVTPARRVRVESVTLYDTGQGVALALPEKKVLLVGPPDDVQQVLERRGQADLSEPLRAALGAAQTPDTLTLLRAPESGLRPRAVVTTPASPSIPFRPSCGSTAR